MWLRSVVVCFFLILAASLPVASQTQARGGRSCDSDNGVASIEVTVPGSGSVPADQQLHLSAVAKDSSGIQMGAQMTWSVSNGSIDWDGMFTPWLSGDVIVTVCSGEVWQNQTINVLQGGTVGVELLLSQPDISADDNITLDPRRLDSKGNSASAFVPTENWSIPENSTIRSGEMNTWEPWHTGQFVIAMNAYGFTANASVNVSHGAAVRTNLRGEANIKVDEPAQYSVEACDAKDNCWDVAGNWSAEPEASLELNHSNPLLVVASANALGLVSLSVSLVIDSQTLEAELDVIISPGAAVTSKVMLGSEVADAVQTSAAVLQLKAGESVYMFVLLEDSVGTQWQTTEVIWILNQSGVSFAETSSGAWFNFSSDTVGTWDLTVSPEDGIPSRYTLEVIPGDAVSIEINPTTSSQMRVFTGASIGLQVIARDADGNPFPYDVVWQIDENVGVMQTDTSGTGSYVFSPSTKARLGTNVLSFIGPDGKKNVALELVSGEVAQLVIIIEGEAQGAQGDEFYFSINAVDANGNLLNMDTSSAVVTCSCGQVKSLKGQRYTATLSESGDRHSISVEMEGLPRTVLYIDVSSTMFGGMLGSNSQVMILGISMTGGLLLLVAVAIYLRSRDDLKEKSEDSAVLATSAQTVSPGLSKTTTPVKAPPVSAFLPVQQLPPPLQQSSAPAHQPPPAADQQLPPPVQSLDGAMDMLAPEPTSVDDEPAPLNSAMNLLASVDEDEDEAFEEESEQVAEGISPQQDGAGETMLDEADTELQEVVLLTSDEGPMTSAGVLLKALPGTIQGEQGWYRGIDGKPMRWDGPQ